MNKELERLKKEIFFGEHSDEEWLKIKSEAENALAAADDKEADEFAECGAEALLEQILEYLL